MYVGFVGISGGMRNVIDARLALVTEHEPTARFWLSTTTVQTSGWKVWYEKLDSNFDYFGLRKVQEEYRAQQDAKIQFQIGDNDGEPFGSGR